MSALTKAMMRDALLTQCGFSKLDAQQIVELLFEELSSILATGNSIKLSSFGNFVLRDKTQRPGRNPKTGLEFPIEARRVVTFKPGLKLKTKMQGQLRFLG